ncbi:hypothetical protein SAICODRAFT_21631 [Saitoella complicata NRRL Y-17804]|uniref:Uncharacterized protein n=1 Tax=Saitoella complicata (strain BCRC 22490 / CBS 7301 / JCM 7358 / NBRC 10748 / NRRL Y-17804) TaxID=698492 RepID=A0A0E9NMS7_SAICN|nr:uncharacterized protein SAICODRAFT_21631 [Saitoella complicata NRRL Y-17804]ODQ50391.1 hypothetical protein SAICODRAFT_21631 [Saitoella complicata NRRL Y-17804]GAO51144.1 hypothetical protein G7K_5255-t1 [Saitoella complicata NRRL Y-17804]
MPGPIPGPGRGIFFIKKMLTRSHKLLQKKLAGFAAHTAPLGPSLAHVLVEPPKSRAYRLVYDHVQSHGGRGWRFFTNANFAGPKTQPRGPQVKWNPGQTFRSSLRPSIGGTLRRGPFASHPTLPGCSPRSFHSGITQQIASSISIAARTGLLRGTKAYSDAQSKVGGLYDAVSAARAQKSVLEFRLPQNLSIPAKSTLSPALVKLIVAQWNEYADEQVSHLTAILSAEFYEFSHSTVLELHAAPRSVEMEFARIRSSLNKLSNLGSWTVRYDPARGTLGIEFPGMDPDHLDNFLRDIGIEAGTVVVPEHTQESAYVNWETIFAVPEEEPPVSSIGTETVTRELLRTPATLAPKAFEVNPWAAEGLVVDEVQEMEVQGRSEGGRSIVWLIAELEREMASRAAQAVAKPF